MAAALYLLLLRLRVWPWLAALATAPLLLGAVLLAAPGVGFALPLTAHMVAFHHRHGTFALTTYTSRRLYARPAPIADCRGLALPSHQWPLSPPEPPDLGMTTNAYMWDLRRSPQYQLIPRPG
jgi:hypothetical protein